MLVDCLHAEAEPTVEMAELKTALKDVLESRGVLSEVKAKLRAEVFHALDDQTAPKPKLCRENLILNELIREYLTYNNYNYTSSILVTESGQPSEPLDRTFLAKELNIPLEGDDSMPLLYRMLTYFTQLQKSKATKVSSDMAMSSTNTTQSVLKTNCVIEKPTFPDT